MDIGDWRKRIDEIDGQLAELLKRAFPLRHRNWKDQAAAAIARLRPSA